MHKRLILFIVWLMFAAALAYTVLSQDTNVHAGVSVGADTNSGLTGSTYAVTAGGDYRKGSDLFSADVNVLRLCKINGGCGFQTDVRGTYARFVRPNIAIQGGIEESRYKVALYGKSAFEVFGGLRFTREHLVIETNYRHDLTSENKLKIAELRFTLYARHHLFFRTTSIFDAFTSGGKKQTNFGQTVTAGFYL